jgi:hypothetical protein
LILFFKVIEIMRSLPVGAEIEFPSTSLCEASGAGGLNEAQMYRSSARDWRSAFLPGKSVAL